MTNSTTTANKELNLLSTDMQDIYQAYVDAMPKRVSNVNLESFKQIRDTSVYKMKFHTVEEATKALSKQGKTVANTMYDENTEGLFYKLRQLRRPTENFGKWYQMIADIMNTGMFEIDNSPQRGSFTNSKSILFVTKDEYLQTDEEVKALFDSQEKEKDEKYLADYMMESKVLAYAVQELERREAHNAAIIAADKLSKAQSSMKSFLKGKGTITKESEQEIKFIEFLDKTSIKDLVLTDLQENFALSTAVMSKILKSKGYESKRKNLADKKLTIWALPVKVKGNTQVSPTRPTLSYTELEDLYKEQD